MSRAFAAPLPLSVAPPRVVRRSPRRASAPRAAADDGGEAASPPRVSKLDPETFVDVPLSPEDLVRAQYEEDTARSMGDSILGGQNVVSGSAEETRDLVPFGADNLTVLRATRKYAEAFEAGVDTSGVVAEALGVKSLPDLSPAQRRYAAKVRAKLEENAQRLTGYTLEATRLYKQGVVAYSKGMYVDSVKWMRAALEETDERSKLGGEIQIQQAMGHYACGQQEEAIAIYEWLMSTHPERSIKKTAEELKYIQEAPKMDIGDDERVEVPLLGDDYGYRRDAWAGKGGGGGSLKSAKPREKTLEEEYADAFEPSVRLPQNPFITAAGTVVALGIAAYSATLAR